MICVHAFIVGVARYGEPRWDADSAARNATSLALMLNTLGVPAECIHLFVDLDVVGADEQRKLGALGVICKPTTRSVIEAFWRKELPSLARAGGKLIVFWSGHGAARGDERLFFCGDYEQAVPSCVFNANEFLAHLRSDPYNLFLQQMFFADVCGTYSKLPMEPTRTQPSTERPVDQLVVYASADGAYAKSRDYGEFTSVLLKLLPTFRNDWPSSDGFIERFERNIQEQSQKPFWIQWRGSHRQDDEHLVNGRDQAKQVLGFLSEFPIAGALVEEPYRQTLRSWQAHPRRRPTSLHGMLEVLAGIDDEHTSHLSPALVEFLVRLAREPGAAHGAAVRRWLNTQCEPQQLAEVQARITAVRSKALLVLDIGNNETGQATTCEARLLDPDGWPAGSFEVHKKSFASATEFAEWLADLVAESTGQAGISELEVHFLVEPPLFHIPFHKFAFGQGGSIGEQFVCVTHYRSRAHGRPEAQPANWKRWIEALENIPLSEAKLLEVSLGSSLPADKGILYASFAHGPSARAPLQTQKLWKLLRLGAPYVCWLHGQLPDDGPGLKVVLEQLIAEAEAYSRVPMKVMEWRLRDCPVAGEIALLWDDPGQTLLPGMKGLS